ncbi:MAG: hypothetical protein ACJ786_13760 [Catenulispora sp.]
MIVGPGRVLAAALATVIAYPASATPDDGARLPRLELRLSPGDVEPPPEQAPPLGYAAVVHGDPLDAIDGRSPRVGDPAIPRRLASERPQSTASEDLAVPELRDGKTISLPRITIDITPSF